MAKSANELFRRIKARSGDSGVRTTLQSVPPSAAPAEVHTEATKANMVSVSLTMPRELFERYKNSEKRGRFRDEMVRQLWKKFK